MSRESALSRPRPRKRFGQHFLVDRSIVRRIAALVAPQPGDVVLEVGPGRGALTQILVATLPRLVAVEIDRDLAMGLRARFPEPGLRLIEGDILKVDLPQVVREEGGERLLVVGNLPYNITAPLLFRFLEQADHIRQAVLMLQREVARRLTAQPGSKDYGLLTVLLGMRAEIETRLQVAREAFRPIPRVNSTVVEMRFADECRWPVRDPQIFTRLVRAAFGQRRKMLRNSLLAAWPSLGHQALEEIARQVQLDLTRRPETLSLEEFARLSDAFVERGIGTC